MGIAVIPKPKFIVDEKGKRKEVILNLKDYQELLEDLEDLRDVALRQFEPTRSFREYHNERMKKR
ncbi:MAG: hypothetical protein AB1349_04370 [Elusimicrobiota bacterium]